MTHDEIKDFCALLAEFEELVSSIDVVSEAFQHHMRHDPKFREFYDMKFYFDTSGPKRTD